MHPFRGWLCVVVLIVVGCAEEDAVDTGLISGLRVDTILGRDGDAGYRKARQARAFVFPADHGPHPGYRSEWWYLTAVLQDAQGHDYGLHYTLFRQALAPEPTGKGPWQTAQAYLAHLAVTDVQQGKHVEAERFARGHPGLAGVQAGDEFSAVIEDWVLMGETRDMMLLKLQAGEADEFSVDVSVTQEQPVVLQGDRGYSEKGAGSASHYYSMPRLRVAGTLQIAGRSVQVEGLGWLDREWSTSVLGDHLTGWDWFALQLDDGRSVMAFQLRRVDGRRDDYDHGLLVDHNALPKNPIVDRETPGVTLLKSSDFILTPNRFYRDRHGVSWPVGWQLQIGDEEFQIHAMLDDQRMDLSIIYWEGLVEVLDADNRRIGRGYMELTGYGG